MNKKQFFTYGAIALLSTTAVPRLAADEKVIVDPQKKEVEVKRDADVVVRSDVTGEHAKLRHSNKASGLIGMEVRNNENQKLGEIKDLVLENPGTVSYAVLSVGGFLGIGEKLIALPPSALKVGEDGSHLILDADKAKIQAAPGFAATAWPSPRDPEIQRFWSDISATGAPASVDTGKKKIYTDADQEKKVKVEVKQD